MILIAALILIVLGFIVYDAYVWHRMMDESESRIMNLLNKAIENVNIWVAAMLTGLWSWGDSSDDDEINE